MVGLHRAWSLHLLNFHLVIHPDGNIWMVDMVESSGWWKARDRTRSGCRPAGHEARSEGRGGRDLHCARPRRCAGSGSPRQPDRVRRNQLLSPLRSTALREPRRATHFRKLAPVGLWGSIDPARSIRFRPSATSQRLARGFPPFSFSWRQAPSVALHGETPPSAQA